MSWTVAVPLLLLLVGNTPAGTARADADSMSLEEVLLTASAGYLVTPVGKVDHDKLVLRVEQTLWGPAARKFRLVNSGLNHRLDDHLEELDDRPQLLLLMDADGLPGWLGVPSHILPMRNAAAPMLATVPIGDHAPTEPEVVPLDVAVRAGTQREYTWPLVGTLPLGPDRDLRVVFDLADLDQGRVPTRIEGLSNWECLADQPGLSLDEVNLAQWFDAPGVVLDFQVVEGRPLMLVGTLRPVGDGEGGYPLPLSMTAPLMMPSTLERYAADGSLGGPVTMLVVTDEGGKEWTLGDFNVWRFTTAVLRGPGGEVRRGEIGYDSGKGGTEGWSIDYRGLFTGDSGSTRLVLRLIGQPAEAVFWRDHFAQGDPPRSAGPVEQILMALALGPVECRIAEVQQIEEDGRLVWEWMAWDDPRLQPCTLTARDDAFTPLP